MTNLALLAISLFLQINNALGQNNTNGSCTHGPENRGCWASGYDITTNWYEKWPTTGNIREYWFEVTNTTLSPDGFELPVLVVNNSLPGPTITADWGDTVRVHVTNRLENNGTSIHWHGIRQSGNTEMDGANGITQCPIAPGQTMTYEWVATQYGTTWWHSHFSLQYSAGIQGPIIINGPSSASYDTDLGAVLIQDWYHHTIFQLLDTARTQLNPLVQTGLINGHGKYNSRGTYWSTTIESKKTYRLRFVNTAVDTMFKLSIDEHEFTVIAADFVPIKPYQTKYLNIGMGQRYDVLITANQRVDNYWLRAAVQTTCSGTNENASGILGIIRYSGSNSNADPTTTTNDGYTDSCTDEPLSSIAPLVQISADQSSFPAQKELTITDAFDNANNNYFTFYVNDTSISADWSNPVLSQLSNTLAQKNDNIFNLAGSETTWVYFTVVFTEGPNATYHPLHL